MIQGDIEIALKLGAVVLLLVINAFFVAAEFALVKIRESQLDAFVAKGKRGAKAAREVARNLDSYLSACQLGVTLASLALGWVGEPVFSALLEPVLNGVGIQSHSVKHYISFMTGFTALTFLHIVAGEQAPKWFAIQRPGPVSLLVAAPLKWFHKISYPFTWVLNAATLNILSFLGLEAGKEGEGHSQEELRMLLTSNEGGHGGFGRRIVMNAFDLQKRQVRDVMRPRQDITFLSTSHTISECREIAEKTRYSRLPLCEDGDLDKTLGVLHIKDLHALRQRATTGRDLRPVCRRLIYVPGTARLESLLKRFLDQKLHIAIVVDEHGGTAGLITLENILEELVGQIQDEFDQENPLIRQSQSGHWEMDGLLPLHELERLIGAETGEEGVVTVGGFLMQRLGAFPKVGDSLSIEGFQLSVLEVDGHKVVKARLQKDGAVPGLKSQV